MSTPMVDAVAALVNTEWDRTGWRRSWAWGVCDAGHRDALYAALGSMIAELSLTVDLENLTDMFAETIMMHVLCLWDGLYRWDVMLAELRDPDVTRGVSRWGVTEGRAIRFRDLRATYRDVDLLVQAKYAQ